MGTLHAAAVACFLTGIGYSQMDFAATEPASTVSTSVVGWLEITPRRSAPDSLMHMTISGRAFAVSGVEGRYMLDIRRRGKGGVANSRQGGTFTVSSGRVAQLGRTAISLQPDDQIEIELRLLVDGEEVFTAAARSGTARPDAKI